MPKKIDLTNAAAALGKKGGSSRSIAKVSASRENGKKGGRPKVPRYWSETLQKWVTIPDK